ncbi:MAG: DUF4838 domain-containing protein [Anaerolineae bacterium]|nr:DUF4838 domain-containing protein [Anaerolineae bacterium]
MDIANICWIRSGDQLTDEVLAYAARELTGYVKRLCGESWPVHPQASFAPAPGTAWLGLCDQFTDGSPLTPAPWDDGFALWADGGGLFIAGRNARSVLFGVYAFLEMQGVRFVFPRVDGEVVPNIEGVALPETPIVELAHYRHRGVCIEGATSLEHALGMIDWCAKKRMNTVFLQFLSSRYFYNQWYERRYNPGYAAESLDEQEALVLDDQVIAAMKKRGLIFHRVGHGWTGAAVGLPRSGWVIADEPVPSDKVRWLAEVDGRRDLFRGIPINTELCYSYGPAFAAFVETIVSYCEQHPELDVVHVWLSDATNNKCECAECRRLSISDWYAKLINALARELARRVPKMRFVFLCYIELLWSPEQVEIEADNAILMFAPIARCYGHGFANAACDDGHPWPRPPLNQFSASRHNAFYLDALRGWRARFGGDSFDFDYHLMWDNWRQLTDTVQARIIHQDLQHLHDLGLDGIVSCQSFRAFYPSGLAMTVLAEALWNPAPSFETLRGHYLEAAFGLNARFAGEYLDQVEALIDTGDPHWRTPPFSNADESRLNRADAVLHRAAAEINALRASTVEPTHCRALDLLAHHVRLLQFIVGAYQSRLRGGDGAAELDRAAEFLRNTEEQYSHYIDTMLALRLCVDRHRG